MAQIDSDDDENSQHNTYDFGSFFVDDIDDETFELNSNQTYDCGYIDDDDKTLELNVENTIDCGPKNKPRFPIPLWNNFDLINSSKFFF